jgi:erythromycin esterase-like protein
MDIRPSLTESHEFFLHFNFPNQEILLIFKTLEKDHSGFVKKDTNVGLNKELASFKLERYIGVVYCPESERLSHYSYSSLSNQFDAIVFMDRTRAIKLDFREE